MSEKVPANDNFKVKFSFTYPRKPGEYWKDNYRIFNGENIREITSDGKIIGDNTNFADRIHKGEDILCYIEWYHDILDSNGRPNYRAIEALGILIRYTMPQDDYWHDVRYEDFQIRTQNVDSWSNTLAYNWIEVINHDVATHLLGILVTAFSCGHIPFKTSYQELQEVINETKDNIVSALDALKKLNLISVKRRGDNNIIVELNDANILTITPDNFDDEETVRRIEKRYNIHKPRAKEEDYDA